MSHHTTIHDLPRSQDPDEWTLGGHDQNEWIRRGSVRFPKHSSTWHLEQMRQQRAANREPPVPEHPTQHQHHAFSSPAGPAEPPRFTPGEFDEDPDQVNWAEHNKHGDLDRVPSDGEDEALQHGRAAHSLRTVEGYGRERHRPGWTEEDYAQFGREEAEKQRAETKRVRKEWRKGRRDRWLRRVKYHRGEGYLRQEEDPHTPQRRLPHETHVRPDVLKSQHHHDAPPPHGWQKHPTFPKHPHGEPAPRTWKKRHLLYKPHRVVQAVRRGSQSSR
ncbi:hypothetical protein JCM8097_002045 [Rhodosporidiobolus ruineniae]